MQAVKADRDIDIRSAEFDLLDDRQTIGFTALNHEVFRPKHDKGGTTHRGLGDRDHPKGA